jgi:threonylcarbamoyladenosine tRNA methylthiotransferase MtaB
MAANTLALIDDCDIVHAHIFPYSPREGTPAARMPQVAPGVAKARAAALRERAAARRADWLRDMVGTTQRVLVERPGDRGHAENFAEVRIVLPPLALSLSKGRSSSLAAEKQDGASTSSARTEIGKIVAVNIVDIQDGKLIGVRA